jgi:hypothetical protein
VSRAAATRRIVTASRPSDLQDRQGRVDHRVLAERGLCRAVTSRAMPALGLPRWGNVGERHDGLNFT